MAFIKNRKISIQWKLNPDVFSIINKSVIFDITRRIGSSEKAVNMILMQEKLLESTMPIIVAMNPDDKNWKKAITNYWNGLAVDIHENGKELELGFIFDIADTNKYRIDFIKELVAKYKIKSNEDLANIVMANIPEDEKYRYGTPIVAEDYLLWRYCQNYRDVANTPEDIEKSSYIRFYIHDEAIAKEEKKALVNLSIKAQEKFVELVKGNESMTKIYNILCVLNKDVIDDIDKMDADEKRNKIFDHVSTNPKEFIALCEDKNIHTKALIERLLSKHILRKMPNTDIIVDVEDASIVLGNTTSETVTWFNLEANNNKISEYKTRLNVIK